MTDTDPTELARVHLSNLFAATPAVDATVNAGVCAIARGRVLSCRACHLRADLPEGTRPVVPAHGTQPWGVLVAAPTRHEHEAGRWGVGRDAKFLRLCLASAGMDPEQLGWGGVVQCWPHHDSAGQYVPSRPPTAAETVACRSHLAGWLGGLDAILLVGAAPLHLWRPDLTVDAARGLIGMWTREDGTARVVGVVQHPAAIMRAENRRYLREQMIDDLHRWATACRNLHGTRLALMGQRCPECRHVEGEGPVTWIDPDGIGWCARHAEGTSVTAAGVERWRDARKAWGRAENVSLF